MCIDNTTVVSYINKMGAYDTQICIRLQRKFGSETRNIWLGASYIRSEDNVEANRESQIRNIDMKWELAYYAFCRAVEIFGYPIVDLFATAMQREM